MLDLEDVLRLARTFPREGADGSPNWAVAGGGAVQFLLDAEKVNGKTVSLERRRLACDREHKDLDVSVFHPEASRFRIDHPHEIICMMYRGKFERLNYRSPVAGYRAGFFIELMTDSHFGFLPPTRRDVVHLDVDGENIWTLSPEYITASKYFHLWPVRQEDALDVRNLRKVYDLDWDRIRELVQQTPLAFLDPAELRYFVEGGEMIALQRRIKSAVVDRHPYLRQLPVDACAMRSYLWLASSEFSEEEMYVALARAQDFIDEVKADKNESLWPIAFGLLACPPRIPRKLIKKLYRNRVHFWPEHLAVQFFRGMLDLRNALSAKGKAARFEEIAPYLFCRYLLTTVIHVLLAELDGTARRIREATDREEVDRLADRFQAFIGLTRKHRSHRDETSGDLRV